jgi:hypothetical protein
MLRVTSHLPAKRALAVASVVYAVRFAERCAKAIFTDVYRDYGCNHPAVHISVTSRRLSGF